MHVNLLSPVILVLTQSSLVARGNGLELLPLTLLSPFLLALPLTLPLLAPSVTAVTIGTAYQDRGFLPVSTLLLETGAVVLGCGKLCPLVFGDE